MTNTVGERPRGARTGDGAHPSSVEAEGEKRGKKRTYARGVFLKTIRQPCLWCCGGSTKDVYSCISPLAFNRGAAILRGWCERERGLSSRPPVCSLRASEKAQDDQYPREGARNARTGD